MPLDLMHYKIKALRIIHTVIVISMYEAIGVASLNMNMPSFLWYINLELTV